ncbi:uncharacterized protein LOC143212308 [Lasioglossum baleicum]|uniref:uncharacterized protein LOC143212308 n=1 Tax=Lasioglossum baleicum TaxID=434251 RepID=UPI003FCED9CA
MWTALLLLFLISSFDVGTARSRQSDPSDPTLEDIVHASARLPKKFREDSRTRRVHIANQTNFDGKVEKIRINSDEDFAGPQAYGMPNKYYPENNDRIPVEKNADREKIDYVQQRVVRAIEAYGKTKEHLETNGEIERVQESPVAMGHQTIRRASESRIARSIDATAKPTAEVAEGSRKGSEDLEAQDAKVFRPLFVYRQQQVAKRQSRPHFIRPSSYGHGYYQAYRPNSYHQPNYLYHAY